MSSAPNYGMKRHGCFGHFSLRAILRGSQCFFVALILSSATANVGQLHPGNVYSLTFTDVDHHQISTADGHVTIISVVKRSDEAKADMLGERMSKITFGDPKVRLINVVNFQQSIISPLRGMVSAMIRSRLDSEAKEVQKKYADLHINRNARDDIFVVADFEGKVVMQLGILPASSEFAVFVFDGKGALIRKWSDVPPQEQLAQAIRQAR